MTDLEIIASCQEGKLDCFGELYEKYVDEIYKFIYLKTYDTTLCEDLTSQTFFKALDKIDTFKINSDANVRAWLYRIAYNGVIDNYKKHRDQVDISEVLECGYENDLGLSIDNKQKLQEIFTFFDTLNPKHKQILIMRLWDDLSYAEISEITGEKLDNCKKIVSRTLSKIPPSHIYILLLLLVFAKNFSILYIVS